eukprot:gene4233-8422_t
MSCGEMILEDVFRYPFPLIQSSKRTKGANSNYVGGIHEELNKDIGRNVIRIKGTVSSNNFIDFNNLFLQGRFIYVQLCLFKSTTATIHFEVISNNNTNLRISLSTLYETPRFLGACLRLPLPQMFDWMVLKLDMETIIFNYCKMKNTSHSLSFKAVKRVQLCSNMMIREFITSDTVLTQSTASLPKELDTKPGSKDKVPMPWVDLDEYCASRHHMANGIESPFSNYSPVQSVRRTPPPPPRTDGASPPVSSITSVHPPSTPTGTGGNMERMAMTPSVSGGRSKSSDTGTASVVGDARKGHVRSPLCSATAAQSPPTSPLSTTGITDTPTSIRRHLSSKGSDGRLPYETFSSASVQSDIPSDIPRGPGPAVAQNCSVNIQSGLSDKKDEGCLLKSQVAEKSELQNQNNDNDISTMALSSSTSHQNELEVNRIVKRGNEKLQQLQGHETGKQQHSDAMSVINRRSRSTSSRRPSSTARPRPRPLSSYSSTTIRRSSTTTTLNRLSRSNGVMSSVTATATETSGVRLNEALAVDRVLTLDKVLHYRGGTAALLYQGKLLIVASGPLLVLVDVDGLADSFCQKQSPGLWRAFMNILPGPGSANGTDMGLETDGAVTQEALPESPRQACLRGHSSAVNIIRVSTNRALLLSAEAACIRSPENVPCRPLLILWDTETGRRAASLRPHGESIQCAEFNIDATLLVTVGSDVCVGRGSHRTIQTLILIWDVANLLAVKSFTGLDVTNIPIARQTSDFHTTCITFIGQLDSYNCQNLVSCGRENIRFWRIRRGHLAGRPVLLTEFCRGFEFTAICLHEVRTGCDQDPRINTTVFAASTKGILLKIDYIREQVLSSYHLHEGAIRSLAIDNGFLVTGGDDCKLRVWPLDFSDFLLEAHHEGAVSLLTLSEDGTKLAVGTRCGTLGVLTLSSHSYRTVLRSHFGAVVAVAARPLSCQEFATVGADGTIRVWNVQSGLQKFEFSSTQDMPLVVAYHPMLHTICCGFSSGYFRVFDVESTSTIVERQQRSVPISQLMYSPVGDKLFVSANDSKICVYNVIQGYNLLKIISTSIPPTSNTLLALSSSGLYLAVCGKASSSVVVVYDTHTLVPALRGNITEQRAVFSGRNSTTITSNCNNYGNGINPNMGATGRTTYTTHSSSSYRSRETVISTVGNGSGTGTGTGSLKSALESPLMGMTFYEGSSDDTLALLLLSSKHILCLSIISESERAARSVEDVDNHGTSVPVPESSRIVLRWGHVSTKSLSFTEPQAFYRDPSSGVFFIPFLETVRKHSTTGSSHISPSTESFSSASLAVMVISLKSQIRNGVNVTVMSTSPVQVYRGLPGPISGICPCSQSGRTISIDSTGSIVIWKTHADRVQRLVGSGTVVTENDANMTIDVNALSPNNEQQIDDEDDDASGQDVYDDVDNSHPNSHRANRQDSSDDRLWLATSKNGYDLPARTRTVDNWNEEVLSETRRRSPSNSCGSSNNNNNIRSGFMHLSREFENTISNLQQWAVIPNATTWTNVSKETMVKTKATLTSGNPLDVLKTATIYGSVSESAKEMGDDDGVSWSNSAVTSAAVIPPVEGTEEAFDDDTIESASVQISDNRQGTDLTTDEYQSSTTDKIRHLLAESRALVGEVRQDGQRSQQQEQEQHAQGLSMDMSGVLRERTGTISGTISHMIDDEEDEDFEMYGEDDEQEGSDGEEEGVSPQQFSQIMSVNDNSSEDIMGTLIRRYREEENCRGVGSETRVKCTDTVQESSGVQSQSQSQSRYTCMNQRESSSWLELDGDRNRNRDIESMVVNHEQSIRQASLSVLSQQYTVSPILCDSRRLFVTTDGSSVIVKVFSSGDPAKATFTVLADVQSTATWNKQIYSLSVSQSGRFVAAVVRCSACERTNTDNELSSSSSLISFELVVWASIGPQKWTLIGPAKALILGTGRDLIAIDWLADDSLLIISPLQGSVEMVLSLLPSTALHDRRLPDGDEMIPNVAISIADFHVAEHVHAMRSWMVRDEVAFVLDTETDIVAVAVTFGPTSDARVLWRMSTDSSSNPFLVVGLACTTQFVVVHNAVRAPSFIETTRTSGQLKKLPVLVALDAVGNIQMTLFSSSTAKSALTTSSTSPPLSASNLIDYDDGYDADDDDHISHCLAVCLLSLLQTVRSVALSKDSKYLLLGSFYSIWIYNVDIQSMEPFTVHLNASRTVNTSFMPEYLLFLPPFESGGQCLPDFLVCNGKGDIGCFLDTSSVMDRACEHSHDRQIAQIIQSALPSEAELLPRKPSSVHVAFAVAVAAKVLAVLTSDGQVSFYHSETAVRVPNKSFSRYGINTVSAIASCASYFALGSQCGKVVVVVARSMAVIGVVSLARDSGLSLSSEMTPSTTSMSMPMSMLFVNEGEGLVVASSASAGVEYIDIQSMSESSRSDGLCRLTLAHNNYNYNYNDHSSSRDRDNICSNIRLCSCGNNPASWGLWTSSELDIFTVRPSVSQDTGLCFENVSRAGRLRLMDKQRCALEIHFLHTICLKSDLIIFVIATTITNANTNVNGGTTASTKRQMLFTARVTDFFQQTRVSRDVSDVLMEELFCVGHVVTAAFHGWLLVVATAECIDVFDLCSSFVDEAHNDVPKCSLVAKLDSLRDGCTGQRSVLAVDSGDAMDRPKSQRFLMKTEVLIDLKILESHPMSKYK